MSSNTDNRDLVLGNIKRALADRSRQSEQLPDFPATRDKFDANAFKQRLRDSDASMEEAQSLQKVPQAVAAYCQQEKLPLRIAVEPGDLARLPWQEAGLTTSDKWNDDLSLAVTGCQAAIAETGQFLVTEKNDQAWLSLVASIHVVVIDMASLRNSLDDLGKIMAADVPTTATLVHGPSRTADIEQTLVLGAHGPCKVHAILISQSSGQQRERKPKTQKPSQT